MSDFEPTSRASQDLADATPARSTSDPAYRALVDRANMLEGKAGQLEDHARSIASHNGELHDRVTAMAGNGNSWQGNRANQFVATWGEANEHVSEWVRNIISAADRLRDEAADLRQQAEDYLNGG